MVDYFINVKLHSYASIQIHITGRGYIGYIDNNSSEISNNTTLTHFFQ
jgi:hypothetical protein